MFDKCCRTLRAPGRRGQRRSMCQRGPGQLAIPGARSPCGWPPVRRQRDKEADHGHPALPQVDADPARLVRRPSLGRGPGPASRDPGRGVRRARHYTVRAALPGTDPDGPSTSPSTTRRAHQGLSPGRRRRKANDRSSATDPSHYRDDQGRDWGVFLPGRPSRELPVHPMARCPARSGAAAGWDTSSPASRSRHRRVRTTHHVNRSHTAAHRPDRRGAPAIGAHESAPSVRGRQHPSGSPRRYSAGRGA